MTTTKRLRATFLYVMAGVLVLGGLVALADGCRLVSEATTDWREVEGEIVGIVPARAGGAPPYLTFLVTVRLRDERGEIERTLSAPGKTLERYQIGTRVTVLVDPDDPEDVRLEPPPPLSKGGSFLAAGLMLTVASAGLAILGRRRARGRAGRP